MVVNRSMKLWKNEAKKDLDDYETKQTIPLFFSQKMCFSFNFFFFESRQKLWRSLLHFTAVYKITTGPS